MPYPVRRPKKTRLVVTNSTAWGSPCGPGSLSTEAPLAVLKATRRRPAPAGELGLSFGPTAAKRRLLSDETARSSGRASRLPKVVATTFPLVSSLATLLWA